MAEKDIRWFKYLSEALKLKYRNPRILTFGSYRFEPTIYKWMRQTFETLHTRYGINYEDYLNIGERPVLERLVKNLQTDPRLSFLNEPTVEEVVKFELPEEFHQTIEQEQAGQPAAPEGAPPSAGAPAGQPPPSAPSRGPSIPQIPQMPQMPALPSVKDVEKEGEEAVKKEEEQVAKAPRAPTGRGIRIPSGVRSAAESVGSQAGVAFKKGSSRALIGARKGLGAAIGRGGRAALGATNFGINVGLNLSNELSRLRVGTIGKKWLWGLLLLLFMVGMLLFATGAGPPPVPPPPTGGDISMCLFTRSDQSPPDAKIKSSTLVSLLSDAERTTSVPAKVLAAIARIESPTFVANADNNHDAFFNRNFTDINTSCAPHFPTSPTGALGMMQIQPKGTTGHFGEGVNYGASFFGKTVDSLTVADYCDVKKSILLAAGFTIKKLKVVYNLGDGIKWDPSWTNNQDVIKKAAETYYGCLPYPSCSTGPFNYGDDMWKSVSSCVVSTVSTCTPPPAGDLKQAIIDNFAITMNGFSQTQLEWTWEKLSCVSGTKFKNLINGTVLTRIDSRTSEQTGCRTINLGNYDVKTTFQVAFTHELGHIVDNCNTNELSRHTDLYNAVYPTEGALTTYSRLAPYPGCAGPGQASEDYAEMIAYYLNPSISEIGPCLGSTVPPNPYAGGAYPQHFQLASTILGPFTTSTTPPPPPPTTTIVASCPIPNGKINCPSYGKLASVPNDSTCASGTNINTGETDIGGHCGPVYRANWPQLCTDSNYISGGNLRRTAKAIDIDGAPNTEVFLPKINNQSLRWFFIAEVNDGVGAMLRIFQSEQTPQGKWTIHLVHVLADPAFTPGAPVDPNQYVAKIAPGVSEPDKITGVPLDHTHVTIGLNIAEPVVANNLQQYDPGWKFPDRDLKMCTN